MCNVNKPTLQAAVAHVVQDFQNQGKHFTAHDITKEIRDRISKDDSVMKLINDSETGTIQVAGKTVPNIEHDDVKQLVHDLHNTGMMIGYGRERDDSGGEGRWEYMPSADIKMDDDEPVPTPSADPGTNDQAALPPQSGDYDGTPKL